jgi:hypothetical protein
MGRMALIIVMGLTLTLGIVGFSLNRSKTGTVENVAGFHKYATARNIAHTAVNIALRALDRNDSMFLANRTMSMSVMGGAANVAISYPNMSSLDTLDLTANATYMDTVRRMNLRLHRWPVPFPTIGQAVGLRVPDVNFSMSGTPSIDGHNHDINGNLLAPSANDKPGVGVIYAPDTTQVLAYASKIDGTKDVVYDTTIADPAQFVQEYINAADRTFTSGTYGSNMTWGSAASPQIVYANGDVKFNGNIEGWGILVVHGTLTLTGTFKFHGLVIAYQDTQIDVQFATGTPDVIGALLMAGATGSNFVMKGNSNVSYSKDAINNAQFINKLQVYRVMYWYE